MTYKEHAEHAEQYLGKDFKNDMFVTGVRCFASYLDSLEKKPEAPKRKRIDPLHLITFGSFLKMDVTEGDLNTLRNKINELVEAYNHLNEKE